MDTAVIIRVLVAGLSGAVTAGSAIFLGGGQTKEALVAAGSAFISTALGYLKQSPLKV